MNTLFLCGPLAEAGILSRLLPEAANTRPALLRDAGLWLADGACFPDLLPGADTVPGICLDLPEGDAPDRMSYLMAGLGAAPVMLEVTAEGQEIAARGFLAAGPKRADAAPWQCAPWRARWGQIAGFAVDEILSHRGSVPPAALPGMLPMILVRAAARAAADPGAPTALRSDMSADQVTVEARHNRHAGFFLTREYRLRHPTFAGGTSPLVRREVFVATDAAIVLPYDPGRDRVLLVEQFRMGPFGRGDPHPWMLEPVAGRIDPGESPQQTARRECVEEAGLVLDRLEHISSHYCSLGCSTEYFHCYLGLCDLPDLAQGEGGLDSEDEDIRTHVLPFEQAMALLSSGEAANGPLVLCLLWLQGRREALRGSA